MDVRPQGHDIIRTWLFSTVVRAHFEHGSVPWTDAAISGWILDPDRKKMSKSRGNVVTPEDLLKEHSADAVRYWAASGRLGTDAAYDTGQIKVGRRLAIKVLNASKFALSFGSVEGDLAAAGDRADRPVAARRPARRRGQGHRRVRGLGLHPRPRGHRAVVLVVLRRLPRARQGPRLRRPG
jgi:valyl-tRNA synthetase